MINNYVQLRKMNIKDFTKFITEQDKQDLLSLRNYLVTQVQQINAQLLLPENHVDKTWVHKANRAKTTMGAKIQAIQSELSRRNQLQEEEKKKWQLRFERQFINAAKEMLDKQTYLELLDRANELARENAND